MTEPAADAMGHRPQVSGLAATMTVASTLLALILLRPRTEQEP